MTARSEHAATFRALHDNGLLVLANAWDAGSARLIESLGAKAIATTSAGVAWSHGYADGNQLPVELLLSTVADVVRVVRVPVSVDVEAGYSDDPAVVAENVARVLEAGGIGINIEDGADDPNLLCSKIEAVKRAAARVGVDVFVNARTDVYLRGLVPDDHRLEETLGRAAKYQAAGTDGLFVPGVVDAGTIRTLAAGTPLPLNVLARPGLPDGNELTALGVRRLSAGSGVAQRVFGTTRLLTAAFLASGASGPVVDGPMSYPDINGLGWPAPSK